MLIQKLTFAHSGGLFFTGDTHFGHRAQCIRRGRTNVDDHDMELIRNWNERVGKNDVVFHLGDFGYKMNADYAAAVFKRLNGRKYLILGNHDNEAVYNLPWAAMPEHRMLVQIGQDHELVLDHYGGRAFYKSHHGTIQLFGHSHNSLPPTKQSLDVGVDAWALAPVTFPEIQYRLDRVVMDHRMTQDLMLTAWEMKDDYASFADVVLNSGLDDEDFHR